MCIPETLINKKPLSKLIYCFKTQNYGVVIYNSGPLVLKVDLLFQKVDLSLQNNGPFICEGSSSEPTEPPWLRACVHTALIQNNLLTTKR